MKIKIRDCIVFALFGTLMYVLQVALAVLPNIEPVSLLIIVITAVFGGRVFLSISIFVILEAFTYPFGTWVIMYMYVWTILALVILPLRKINSAVFFAIISGIFGLLFGFLCSLTYLFVGGMGGMWAYFLSGIIFDLHHAAGNFVICLILYRPLCNLLTMLKKRYLL